jgi:hypothetical protein
MTELIDVRADAIAPGECICLGGALILVTAVELNRAAGIVDLHTEFGPALRLLRQDVVAAAVVLEETTAA